MQEILSHMRRCVEDYDMIHEGDVVAVGVSGGKDSVLMLAAMARLATFYPARFTVKAITVTMGYGESEMCFEPIRELCQKFGVEYISVPSQIKQIVFDIRNEKNPCALCANLRRGALYTACVANGCNKAALGHHLDDAAETFAMSLFYEGRINCFSPVTYLDRSGITVIRPMLYSREKDIRRAVRNEQLPVVHNPCPANGETKRQEAKELIRELSARFGKVDQKIFGAMQRLPLDGWKPLQRANSAQKHDE